MSASSYDYILAHLFRGAPLTAEELTSTTVIPVMHESGIRTTTLGALKSYFDKLSKSMTQWRTISASGTLELGYSYLAKSTPEGMLVAMPEGMPINCSIGIHASGGPVTVVGMPAYRISGTDGTVTIADGETVYLLHDDAGHLEII